MDLAQLAALYEFPGPFLTIYLDTSGDVQDAADRVELRWKNVLREFDDLGVDGRTREALTEARGDHTLGSTRVLVAAGGAVHLAESLPNTPAQEVVRLASLPHLLPLVDQLSLVVPHVVVLTDREGADVLAYGAGPAAAGNTTVQSGQHPVHKTGLGGLAAQRYQHRVENSWDASARDVATKVEGLATDVEARLVVAAGDGHATQLLHEHLPKRLQDRYVVVDGSRAADGGDKALSQRVLTAVGDVVTSDILELLGKYAEERGQQDRAAEGEAATMRRATQGAGRDAAAHRGAGRGGGRVVRAGGRDSGPHRTGATRPRR